MIDCNAIETFSRYRIHLNNNEAQFAEIHNPDGIFKCGNIELPTDNFYFVVPRKRITRVDLIFYNVEYMDLISNLPDLEPEESNHEDIVFVESRLGKIITASECSY